MKRIFISLLLALSLLGAAVPARPYTFQYASSTLVVRWPTNTITVALSSSLSNPPANIKPGTDVVQAARNALQRWSEAANVNFNIINSSQQDAAQDGVSLITVADTPANRSIFTDPGENQGRTRVFFNPANGAITEADLVLNPATTGSSGYGFSADGTNDTFDIESTFVHEIGHMLGLNHSAVLAATMMPHQGRNFAQAGFNVTMFSMRTLSDDDLAGIRALYGARVVPPPALGSLAGHVNYGAGAHVWAENLSSGRIVGSTITKSDGSYQIDQLPKGNYRVGVEFLDEPVAASEVAQNSGPYVGLGSQPAFTTIEGQASSTPGTTATLNLTVNTGSAPTIRPQLWGLNGFLTGVATQVAPGLAARFYLGGTGVDTVGANGFSFNTPFITIDRSSFQVENSAAFGVSFPIVSFNIKVADTGKVGDYSLRMQRPDTNELNYLPGALTIDPYPQYVELNPIDRNDFFVTQHYLDFLSRQPDPSGFNAWTNLLNNCSDVNNNPQCDRITVSQSFYQSQEFQLKGFYVYRFYKLAFNRQPTYAEIVPDMQSVTGATQQEVFQKRAAFANNFVQRTEFINLYAGMTNATFVNTLMDRYGLASITTPDPANPDGSTKVTLTRVDLLNGLNANTLTRAQVVRAIADSDEVGSAEFNPGFVFMQYVGYLRRDPDTAGFNSWLNYLSTHANDFRTMVNGFVNSQEYRTRFGQP